MKWSIAVSRPAMFGDTSRLCVLAISFSFFQCAAIFAFPEIQAVCINTVTLKKIDNGVLMF